MWDNAMNRALHRRRPPTRTAPAGDASARHPPRKRCPHREFPRGKHATFNMRCWSGTSQLRRQGEVETLLELMRAQPRKATYSRWRANRRTGGASSIRSRCCPASRPSTAARCSSLVPKTARPSGSALHPPPPESKERKLQPLPGFRYLARKPTTRSGASSMLLYDQAAAHGDPEAAQCVRRPRRQDFIFATVLAKSRDGGHAIEIHALECDEEVIAIFAGVADGPPFLR